MGEISYDDLLTKGDTFPMGIDYMKYHLATGSKEVKTEKNKRNRKRKLNF